MMAAAALVTCGLAAAEARDVRPSREPKAKVTDTTTPAPPAAPAVPESPIDKAETGHVVAERIVQAPQCARKVKVVYAGYGEGDRARCPAETEASR